MTLFPARILFLFCLCIQSIQIFGSDTLQNQAIQETVQSTQSVASLYTRLINLFERTVAKKAALALSDEHEALLIKALDELKAYPSNEESSNKYALSRAIVALGHVFLPEDIRCTKDHLDQVGNQENWISQYSETISDIIATIRNCLARNAPAPTTLPTRAADDIFSPEEFEALDFLLNKAIECINRSFIVVNNILGEWPRYAKDSPRHIAVELHSQCEAIKNHLQEHLIQLQSVTSLQNAAVINNAVIDAVIDTLTVINILNNKFQKVAKPLSRDELNLVPVKYALAPTFAGTTLLERCSRSLAEKNGKYFIPVRTQWYEKWHKKYEKFTTRTVKGRLLNRVLSARWVITGSLFAGYYNFLNRFIDAQAEIVQSPEKSQNPYNNESLPIKVFGSFLGTLNFWGQTIVRGLMGADKFDALKTVSTMRQALPVASTSIIAGIFTAATLYWDDELNKRLGYKAMYEESKDALHKYLMDELRNPEDDPTGSKKFSDYDLYSAMFEALRTKGTIQPLIDLCKVIEDPYGQSSKKSTPHTYLLTGPSGCGKTTVCHALCQTIANKGLAVTLLEWSPKRFAIDNKKQDQMDMFEVIMSYVQTGGDEVIVIYLDEFHLFFADEHGKISADRVDGFLRVFSEICTKQKNNKGGLYIIASTNKPELIPHEILDNPSRVARPIRIEYPNHDERISLMHKRLTAMGIPHDTIDLAGISQILEGSTVSQGKIMEIIDKSVERARLERKMLSTAHIYEAINHVARRVNKDLTGCSPQVQKATATYYAATSVVQMLVDRYAHFDSATIYAVEEEINPSPFDDIYKRPTYKPLQYGSSFNWNEDGLIDLVSHDRVMTKCLALLAGNAYCMAHNLDIIKEARSKNRKQAIALIEEFLEPALVLDAVNGTYKAFVNETYKAEVQQQALALIHTYEKYLTALFKQERYKNMVEQVADLLNEKKFVTRNDISSLVPQADQEALNILMRPS